MALSAETALPARRPTMSSPRALVAMARPSQVVLIGTIYAAGLLLGLSRPEARTDLWPMFIGLVLISGAAVAAHLVNEAEDAATDRLSVRTAFSGGSGALAASGIHASIPLRLGLGLAGFVAVATWLAWFAGLLPGAAVTLVLLGLVGALFYSLPPIAAMRHGWGEPLNAGLGGMLLPLAGVAVVTGALETIDILAFLPFTFVVLASVMATAWPDRVADAATGKATMQVRLRPARLRRIHLVASVLFLGALIVAAVAGASPYVGAGLLVVPLLVVGVVTYTRRESPLPNVVAMVGLAAVLLLSNALGLIAGWSG